MYRKRWERSHEGLSAKNSDTPRTKTRKILQRYPAKTVRKTLVFHHVLLEELRNAYKSKSTKKSVKDILAGNILKKYKFRTCAKMSVGAYKKQGKVFKRGSLSKHLSVTIKVFFERDDNSRLSTGKKRKLTWKGVKKQKRLLCSTLENLHQKYLAENSCDCIGNSTFCRLRPFWIVAPTEADRDTCLCKTCDNMQHLADSLHREGLMLSPNLDYLVKLVASSKYNKQCMYGECLKCKEKPVKIKIKVKTRRLLGPNGNLFWKTGSSKMAIQRGLRLLSRNNSLEL